MVVGELQITFKQVTVHGLDVNVDQNIFGQLDQLSLIYLNG